MLTIVSFILCVLAALLNLRARREAPPPLQRTYPLATLAGLGVAIAVVMLFATGFGGLWTAGSVGGTLLLIHVPAGGLLAAAAALYVPLAAERHADPALAGRGWFWLAALATLGALGSALLMMTPLVGTRGQELLLAIHGWSALAAVIGWAFTGRLALWRRRAGTKPTPSASMAENT